MTKRYKEALTRHREQGIFMAGLLSATGFTQKGVKVKKTSDSASSYTLSRKISLLVNSITSFSNKPLIYISYLGMFLIFPSFGYTTYIICRKLFFGIDTEGWTSLMASLWLIGGLIILSLGVIGLYISRIFLETKQRPYTLIRKDYKK